MKNWSFLKNPANPHDENLFEGLVCHFDQRESWFHSVSLKLRGILKKYSLILGQNCCEFLDFSVSFTLAWARILPLLTVWFYYLPSMGKNQCAKRAKNINVPYNSLSTRPVIIFSTVMQKASCEHVKGSRRSQKIYSRTSHCAVSIIHAS